MAERRRGAVIAIDDGGHRERVLARRDELITEHLSLVRSIALRIHASLPPSFELDDLFAEGYHGLLTAASLYRPEVHGGCPFSAYARRVIRGAILDAVTGKPYSRNTMPPIDEENLAAAAEPASAEERVDRSLLLARVSEAIARLPPRQAQVLREYYRADEPSFKTVAKRLCSSYGAVWQLHTEAIRHLRELLDDEAA